MKKILALIALGLLSGVALAQNPATFGGVSNAYAFAYGINPTVPALQVDEPSPSAPGVATLSVAYGNVALVDGTILTPLSTFAPVTVGIGATQETVTPTAVNCLTPQVYQSCTFTATFTYAHGTGDRVSSGSNGLEEAAVYRSGKGGGLVILSSDWFGRYASHAAGLTALVTFKSVNAAVTVLDYSGVSGALSYNAAANSVYVATAHVLY